MKLYEFVDRLETIGDTEEHTTLNENVDTTINFWDDFWDGPERDLNESLNEDIQIHFPEYDFTPEDIKKAALAAVNESGIPESEVLAITYQPGNSYEYDHFYVDFANNDEEDISGQYINDAEDLAYSLAEVFTEYIEDNLAEDDFDESLTEDRDKLTARWWKHFDAHSGGLEILKLLAKAANRPYDEVSKLCQNQKNELIKFPNEGFLGHFSTDEIKKAVYEYEGRNLTEDKDLSTVAGSMTQILQDNKDKINSCTTPQEVHDTVAGLLAEAGLDTPATKRLLMTLKKQRNIVGALQAVYNSILKGSDLGVIK